MRNTTVPTSPAIPLRSGGGRILQPDIGTAQRDRVCDDLEKLQHFTRQKAPVLQNVLEILACESLPEEARLLLFDEGMNAKVFKQPCR